MATTHVFIVNSTTFKYHLEYQFVGTGAKDKEIDFNDTNSTDLSAPTENNLVGMIADFQRIRKGDFAIFYLQREVGNEIFEGKFYGIFKIKDNEAFLDNLNSEQYLTNELGKSLTFRACLEPFKVFPKGVTEWEALDSLENITSPNQMLWSLIYRKLKGNRGNTMITLYESEKLFTLLRSKNNNINLEASSFSFDIKLQEITPSQLCLKYKGRRETINILPRLIDKYKKNKAFETHLQAYIIQNIGKNTNKSLDEFLIKDLKIEWIGNEVSCGVGMQRIDIALSLTSSNSKVIIAIELKAVEAHIQNIQQIQRYIDWLKYYYLPNTPSTIQPILIAKKFRNKTKQGYTDILDSFIKLNNSNPNCLPIKYIEYEILNDELVFNKIDY